MGFITDALGMTSRDPVGIDYKARREDLDLTNYHNAVQHAVNNMAERPEWQQLTDALVAQSQGKGPSIAQTQLGMATQENIGRAAGLASSRKGTNPALAAKMGIDAAAAAGQQAAGQSALMRAQEQLSAQDMLRTILANRQQLQTQATSVLGGLQTGQNQLLLGQQAINQSTDVAAAQLAQRNREARAGAAGKMIDRLTQAGAKMAGAPGGDTAAAGGGMGGNATMIPYAHGGLIPGDHPANDVVPAMLSPGEIVLPRSVTMAPDAAERAMAFVEAIKNSKRKK